MTNQLASLEQRDYFYLDPFSSVNLGTYIIKHDAVLQNTKRATTFGLKVFKGKRRVHTFANQMSF